MKLQQTILIITLALLSVTLGNAQPGIPYKMGGSVLFGKDIIIHDRPARNQKLVAVCSAFNGWLYAAYTFQDSLYNSAAVTLLKSTDDGITWSSFMEADIGGLDTQFTCIGLETTGNSVSDLKLFLILVYSGVTVEPGSGLLVRYNGVTGEFEQQILGMDSESIYTYYMDIASDIPFSSPNTNPGSLGVIYQESPYFISANDSLIFRSSSNGGITLDSRRVVTVSSSHIHKVSLAYGRCYSYPNGRYFAAWEEQDEVGAGTGRIYTAHTDPDYNSPFTTPVRLDNIDPADANLCRNPVIVCQYNNVDNDSANLTEVVMFEKYDAVNHRSDIVGYSNLQASTTSHFNKFTFANPAQNNLQPDICFNTFNSSFLVTYFDSTNLKLPFLSKNFNLVNPNTWTITNPGYNDSINIIAPHPKVRLNYGEQDGMNVWVTERSGGNGIAMFDAPYSTYTVTSTVNSAGGTRLLGAYPNPCKSTVTIGFELPRTEKVTIEIYSITGQPMQTVTDQVYSSGKHQIKADISTLPQGIYLYTFNAGEFVGSGKIAVVR